MSLKFEYLPRLYEQSHWKKDTTAVLFKDENFLWAMFYWHQSGHGNVITPITFLMKIALLLGYDKLSWQSAHLPKTQKANTASNNRSWPTCLIPSAHSTPRYFLGLQRHAGHKYSLFLKPISLIAVKNITVLNFKNLRYLLEGKQIVVVISICIAFALFSVGVSVSTHLCILVAIDYLSKSSLVLSVFSLVVCLLVFVGFFFSTLHFTFSTKWKTVLPACLHRMSWQFSQLWDMEEVWALSWHCACVLPPEWLRKNLWVLQK